MTFRSNESLKNCLLHIYMFWHCIIIIYIFFSDPDEVEFCGSVPIFIRGSTALFSAEKVIEILAKEHVENVLCKHQPCRVQINASFLVNLRVVALEDLEADENGSYENLGSRT